MNNNRIKPYLPLCRAMARRYPALGEDGFQIASVATWEALESYDSARGTETRWVSQNIAWALSRAIAEIPDEAPLGDVVEPHHEVVRIRHRTMGSALLAEVASHRTQYEVARAVGVVQSTVAKWVSGDLSPSESRREKLLELYAIPCVAWVRHTDSPMGMVRIIAEEALRPWPGALEALVHAMRAMGT